MSSVPLGYGTESQHSKQKQQLVHWQPNMQKCPKTCCCSGEKHSNVLSSRFHVVQYWLRKNIFTRLTQIFAFGPRHLISTDDLNYNGALSMILVLYLKLVTSPIWRHDPQQRRSPNTFWSSTLPSTIQVNEIKGWKILLWKQLTGVIYIYI